MLILAATVSELAVTVLPEERLAESVMVASVMATPAPIAAVAPAAPPPAEPSATVAASVSAVDEMVTAPDEASVDPVPSKPATDALVTRSIPTAAAASILPPDVDAEGVCALPVPLPPTSPA